VGWRDYGPYDAILVSAAGPDVPAPLLEQLAPGGRLLVPIGRGDEQVLRLYRRTEAGIESSEVGAVRFVPLVGKHGWHR
jgi:protein-L-isoaspartate(D-aspartate) O-methyltransferase